MIERSKPRSATTTIQQINFTIQQTNQSNQWNWWLMVVDGCWLLMIVDWLSCSSAKQNQTFSFFDERRKLVVACFLSSRPAAWNVFHFVSFHSTTFFPFFTFIIMKEIEFLSKSWLHLFFVLGYEPEAPLAQPNSTSLKFFQFRCVCFARSIFHKEESQLNWLHFFNGWLCLRWLMIKEWKEEKIEWLLIGLKTYNPLRED